MYFKSDEGIFCFTDQGFRLEKLKGKNLQTAWHSEEAILDLASSTGVMGSHVPTRSTNMDLTKTRFTDFTASSHEEDVDDHGTLCKKCPRWKRHSLFLARRAIRVDFS